MFLQNVIRGAVTVCVPFAFHVKIGTFLFTAVPRLRAAY